MQACSFFFNLLPHPLYSLGRKGLFFCLPGSIKKRIKERLPEKPASVLKRVFPVPPVFINTRTGQSTKMGTFLHKNHLCF